MKGQRTRLEAAAEHRGLRVDQFLASRCSELSRSRLQQLIEAGHVRLNGSPVKSAYRLKGGEALEVEVPPPEPAEPLPEDLPLVTLYEDRHLLVIDKAAGMVVHPGAGHRSGTLVNALLHHVKDLEGVGGVLRPGLVHRLDKDTTGALVVAKSDASLRALQRAFKSREVEKRYVALVRGQPPEVGTFHTLYGRHPRHRLRFTGRCAKGRAAVTHFTVRRRFAKACLVEVSLETGRTHQIRVHLAEAGFPLLGDALYGPKAAQRPEIIGRQALHAWRLAFAHPMTGRALAIEADWPADFCSAIERLALETEAPVL